MTKKTSGQVRRSRGGDIAPLTKTLDRIKKKVSDATGRPVPVFRRFVALYVVPGSRVRFVVRAVNATTIEMARNDAAMYIPSQGRWWLFVLTTTQAEHLRNSLEEAESVWTSDVVVLGK